MIPAIQQCLKRIEELDQRLLAEQELLHRCQLEESPGIAVKTVETQRVSVCRGQDRSALNVFGRSRAPSIASVIPCLAH